MAEEETAMIMDSEEELEEMENGDGETLDDEPALAPAPGSAEDETEKEDEVEVECEEGETEADVLLFTFFMLLLGLVAKDLLSKVPVLRRIPYTGMLLLIGLGFGFIHAELRPDVEPNGRLVEGAEFRRGYQHLGRGIQAWTSISPELLLLIHLPALIFASGFSVDFHIFRRNIWQILILAGPGVAIGTGLTSVVAKYIFRYDWCWPKALLFGAMLSATDPVAVVALLKEVGASATLGTVIEGESLFNDGTAFVFFLLFRDRVKFTPSCNNGECNDAFFLDDPEWEEEISLCDNQRRTFTARCEFANRDVGGSFRFFFRMAFGAPVIGIGFAIFASIWINFVYNDMVIEVAITFVTAYLAYFCADELLSMSGVLATVALGISMVVLAKPRLSPKAHEPMEVFWEIIEWIANTMIFVYSGVKIALVLWEKSIDPVEEKSKFIDGDEWGWAIVLYLFLQIIRFATIMACWPFMLLSGYEISFKDVIVMTWGGLRGAVGLALALIVDLDYLRIDPEFRALTIFYMGTMAAATLIINGTTMPLLLAFLGTTAPKPEKLEVLLHVVKEIEQSTDTELREFEPDDLLGDPDPNLVRVLTQLNVSSIIPSDREVCKVMKDAQQMNNPLHIELGQHIGKNVTNEPQEGGDGVVQAVTRYALFMNKQENKHAHKTGQAQPTVITKDMLIADFRTRLLTGVKSVYGELSEEGTLAASQIYTLRESVDESLDTVDKPLSDWFHLEQSLTVDVWRKILLKISPKVPSPMECCEPIVNIPQLVLFASLENSAVMARSLIHAHEEASHSLKEYVAFVKQEHYENNTEMAVTRLIEEAGEQVLGESREELSLAVDFLKNMRRAYPEVSRAIKSKLAAWEVLQNKAKYVDQLSKSGLIEPREANALSKLIETKLKKLIYHPPHVDLPETRELLHSHPLFADLSRQTFDSQVLPNAKPKQYDKDHPIFEIGHESHHLTLVVRGVVRVECPGAEIKSVQEGSGAMIGVSEVLLGQRRSRSLVAESHVEVYHIEAEVFKDLVSRYESVRMRAWQMAGAFLTTQNPWGQYRNHTFGELQSVFRRAELKEYSQGDQFTVEGTSYLASGDVAEINIDNTRKHPISGPTPLGQPPTVYVCLSEVKILQLPEEARAGRFARQSTTFQRTQTLRRDSFARLSQRSIRPTGLAAQLSMGAIDRPSIVTRGLGNIPEGGENRQNIPSADGQSAVSSDAQARQDRNRPGMGRNSTPSRTTTA